MLRRRRVFQYRKDVSTRSRETLAIENTSGNGWWLIIDCYPSFLTLEICTSKKSFDSVHESSSNNWLRPKVSALFSFRDALLAACVETANVSNKQHKNFDFPNHLRLNKKIWQPCENDAPCKVGWTVSLPPTFTYKRVVKAAGFKVETTNF